MVPLLRVMWGFRLPNADKKRPHSAEQFGSAMSEEIGEEEELCDASMLSTY